jgi:cation diffusion facilitator CzcD-associated flavoprotein CzcO
VVESGAAAARASLAGATGAGRICVVGAGCSGLTSVKALTEAGLPVDAYEMGSSYGGNWRYDNDNGRAAAYDSLRIDTSKGRMAFSDLPMPESYPDYPHHSQVLAYFESYVERFGLASSITFRTRVESVTPASGGYRVRVRELDGGAERNTLYRAVLVCNGHHWCPNLPEPLGSFAGESLHSRLYRSPEGLRGKRVLVVGIGNSGADIACDAAPLARRTLLASRRGAHVIPRYLLGRPTDTFVTPLGSRLPLAVQRAFCGLLLRLARGPQERYGLPPPQTRLLSEHPTLSTDLLPLVADGRVVPKPEVAELGGDRVRFADGSEEAVDVIIWATGYRIRFPFLDRELFPVADNRVSLYGRVVDPDRPGLYFIGLIQPLGAIMPLAELQARWVAGLLSGRLELPRRRAMKAWIERDRRALARRYLASPRHTIQVDFFPYRRFLERQLRRRARRAGEAAAAAPQAAASPGVE